MKSLKTLTFSLIVAFIAITGIGLAVNITSLFANWKPTVIPDQAYALSIATLKSSQTIQPGQYILLTSNASGQTQHVEVTTIVPNGETTYQVETTLNTNGDITTFTTGATTWVEDFSIPVLGLVLMPFTSGTSIAVTLLSIFILLTWYRWHFYGRTPKPEVEKIDNIGILQNFFDNAPNLTKKEAKRLTK